MKKVWMLALACALCAPAFAEKMKCDGDKCPMKKRPVMTERQKGKDARADAFKKARKEHKAKMKATEEKMEKLVEEYNKLKPGKKKDAKKAEIAAMVASIRDEQIKFKEEQLGKFNERLEQMKKSLDEQKSEEAKKAWVEKKTDEVIADEGDLDVLFERPEMPGPGGRGMGPGPRMERMHGPHGPVAGPAAEMELADDSASN